MGFKRCPLTQNENQTLAKLPEATAQIQPARQRGSNIVLQNTHHSTALQIQKIASTPLSPSLPATLTMKAECYLLFPFMATLFNVLFVVMIQHSRVAHAAVGHEPAAYYDMPPEL